MHFSLSQASISRENPASASLVRLVQAAVTKGGVEEENATGTTGLNLGLILP